MRSAASTSTSSPPASRKLFARRTPSTLIAPAASRRSASARDSISGRPARKRSSLSPAASSGTRSRSVGDRVRSSRLAPVGREQGHEQDHDARDDEGVREVESGPEAEVDEVRDVPEPQAVDQVRSAAADQQAQRDGKDRVPRAGTGKEPEHPPHRDRGQYRDDQRRAREQPERDARVL